MAMSAKSDDGDVVSEINVTPLVDVMLVLLVVFIVTAPLLSNAVTVNLPKTALNNQPIQKKSLQIKIDKAGQITIDGAAVALNSVERELKKLKIDAELAVQLSADPLANYGVVAKTISAIDRGGVTRLSVLPGE